MPRLPVLFPLFLAAVSHAARLASPDGRLTFDLDVAADGSPRYAVAADGKPLVVASRLGPSVKGSPFGAFEIAGETRAEADETWTPVCGETSRIRDRYRTMTVKLRERDGARRELDVIVRAYDAGVAFRYAMPAQPGPADIVIADEPVEFRFPAEGECHATTGPQGLYSRVPSVRLPAGTVAPLTVASPSGFLALAEADADDFPRLRFRRLPDGAPGVSGHLDGAARMKIPFVSPWRVVMAAPTPGKLLENNGIIPNLNPPCAIANTSWIRPGTVLREVTLTTGGARRAIDFCASHRVAYLLFDAGWYGDEWSPASDASRVNVDPKRSKGPLDLPGVIRYAKDRGVGVILYINAVAMRKQLDRVLPLYREWGVAGVKYGFVPVGSQEDTRFVAHAIRAAAENRLMVDIHDNWRPTGQSRTWPNLMTSEGIRGDEERDRKNAQSLTHLFTRFLAGPADNTFCYYDARVDRLCDHACQLGKSVCFFGPWQFLYWYDRPSDGSPVRPGDNRIGDEPELVFFDRLPTVWDETRVLAGEIGAFAVVARRSGDTWRLGGMNAATPRELSAKLDFLPPGRVFDLDLYTNDPATPTRTHVKIEHRRVTSSDTLRVPVGAESGFAAELFPAGGV